MIDQGLLSWSELSLMPLSEKTNLGQHRVYWRGEVLTQREAQTLTTNHLCSMPATPEMKRMLNLDRARMYQCGFFDSQDSPASEKSYDRVVWIMSPKLYAVAETKPNAKDILLAILNPVQ